MAITFMHENPQFDSAVDVVVYYSNVEGKKMFLVSSTDASVRGCYYVEWDALVGSQYIYINNVIDALLPRLPEDEDTLVLITNQALNAISLVCENNRPK